MDKNFIKKGIELLKKADAVYLTTIDPFGLPSTSYVRQYYNLEQYDLKL